MEKTDEGMPPIVDTARRFGGIDRLYGNNLLARLQQAHITVVGIGGVGSWAAEALARSGVGQLRLIDLDHVAESNINRQAHALENTLGQAKVLAMRDRLQQINPALVVESLDDFIDDHNVSDYLHHTDLVIDAVDQVCAKVAMVLHSQAHQLPLITVGGAGAKTDPTQVRSADLARTTHDPLLAQLRRTLRKKYPFAADAIWGIDAVYSVQSPQRTAECATPVAGQALACAGYGSSMMVTATFGLTAAALALEKYRSNGL